MPSPGRGPHVPLPRVRRGQHGHSRHLSLGTRRSALGLVRTLIAADLPSWPCEFDSGIPHYTDRDCAANGVFGPTRRTVVRWDGHCE